MAYVTTNPPALVTQTLGGTFKRWVYVSADSIATVNTAAYISNGYALGMRVGDEVIVRDTATPTTSICSVITATAGGSVDLSDGTTVALTNSD